jgi:hypothetical protein
MSDGTSDENESGSGDFDDDNTTYLHASVQQSPRSRKRKSTNGDEPDDITTARSQSSVPTRKSPKGEIIMTWQEIQGSFHLPLTRAAKELGVCDTVLKQQCRKLVREYHMAT